MEYKVSMQTVQLFFLNSLSRTCFIYHKILAGEGGDVEDIEKSWSCCH